ncbi:MAG: flagellar protein FlaG [Burkholderiaceae bacterium]|nr:flagellar protein FlaG [Sulfuritalea sp.]MCF8176830.1 flagellar protein FlaG [Burkholderiaceae bacterium]MCF8185096.1 flagellar protein FlaG [Polynucleobacter sp.]
MNIQAISSSGVSVPVPAAPQGGAAQSVSPQPQAVFVQALPNQSSQAQPASDRAQVEEAVAKVKVQIQAVSRNSLDFSIDDSTGKTVVRITDHETGEMIRQIPSQEMLDIARSIDRMQGILVQQKV